MSVFSYQAVNPAGQMVQGEMEAQSRAEALNRIERQNLQPVSVVLKGGGTGGVESDAAASSGDGEVSLSRAQIIHFTDELSDLLDAGLQLEPALRIMEQREESSGVKKVASLLRQKVREGVRFSVALKSCRGCFDELYCNLASAGELSGALPEILRRQARYLASMHDLQNRVLQALIYPSFMILAGAGLLMVFMTVLVPKMMSLFAKTGSKMPLLTRLLISFSTFLSQYWWTILLGIAVALLVFFLVIRQKEGRLWWDQFQLQIPLFGPVLASRFYVQFTQTLATLIMNGIPLLNALRLLNLGTPNLFLRDVLSQVTEKIAEGGHLSRAMKKIGHFPPILVDMIAVGEQTGDLGAALEKISRRYEKDLGVHIQRLTAMIQPAIIVVMALLVGVVAYSMLTGIFDAIGGLRSRR